MTERVDSSGKGLGLSGIVCSTLETTLAFYTYSLSLTVEFTPIPYPLSQPWALPLMLRHLESGDKEEKAKKVRHEKKHSPPRLSE